MAKKKYESDLDQVINPATGTADLIGAIKHTITVLNNEDGIVRGAVYHRLPGAMDARLDRIGIEHRFRGRFCLLLQRLAVLRREGANSEVVWEVVCTSVVDEFLTERMLRTQSLREQHYSESVANWYKQKQASDRIIATLKQQLADLQTQVAEMPVRAPSIIEHVVEAGATLEQLAEAVARAKDLETQLEGVLAAKIQLEGELTSLRVKLEATSNPAAVAAAMIAELRTKKV